MELTFHNDYKHLTDKEIVDRAITKPYDDEAVAYLIHIRYSPLLRKLYLRIFANDQWWYADCLSDLFGFLKGENGNWNKLRTFEWRCKFGTWLSCTARHRFLEIKPKLIGKITNPISIDMCEINEEMTPIQIPDNDWDRQELLRKQILLMEAISKLKDPDQKFVILKRLQGYSSKEIAELMKMSWAKHGVVKRDNKGNIVVPTAGYVDVRTQRAKENLKKIIVKLL